MPWMMRNSHDLLDALGDAAQHGGDGEADDAYHQQLLDAVARRQPADRRRHDGGGHHVGGEHPAHLVERGGQAALHVGQRHVGDGDVEHLHDGRHHHADGDQQPLHGRREACARGAGGDHWSGSCATALEPKRRASLPRRPVSISTKALMPARRRRRSWPGRELDAHRHALHDLDPVAGRVLRRQDGELRAGAGADGADRADPLLVGKRVDRDGDGLAAAHVGEVGLLGVGVDPHVLAADDAEHGRAGRQEAPHLDARHLRRHAGDGGPAARCWRGRAWRGRAPRWPR